MSMRQTVEDKALAFVRAAIWDKSQPSDETPYAVKVLDFKAFSDTVQVTFQPYTAIQIVCHVRYAISNGAPRFNEFNQVFTVRDQRSRFKMAGADNVDYDYAGITMTAYNWGDALRAAKALNQIRLAREQVIGLGLEGGK